MGITQQSAAARLIQPGVIDNTAARPASPYEGQVIFQKDTDQLLVWNGTTWVIPNSPAQNPTGMELVKSQTIGTGVSSETVTNAFSANYDQYMVTVSGGVGTTSVELSVRLGAVTTNYRTSIVYTTYTSATTLAIVSNANNCFQYVGRATTAGLTMNCHIRNPWLPRPTFLTTNYVAEDASGVSNGIQFDNTSFTDFTVFPQLGTMTGGTIRVYGYRNS